MAGCRDGRRLTRWSFIAGLLTGPVILAVLRLLPSGPIKPAAGVASTSATAGAVVAWVRCNLRLSVVPFTLALLCYSVTLVHLHRQLRRRETPIDRVAQAEHLLDTWINLFFGIGVVWTAIGMRSALLSALGDLDPTAAVELGAFVILRRLVDGGILLALSTTIFGGVGGYVLRVVKALCVGGSLQRFYAAREQAHSLQFLEILERIDQRLERATRLTTPLKESAEKLKTEPGEAGVIPDLTHGRGCHVPRSTDAPPTGHTRRRERDG